MCLTCVLSIVRFEGTLPSPTEVYKDVLYFCQGYVPELPQDCKMCSLFIEILK